MIHLLVLIVVIIVGQSSSSTPAAQSSCEGFGYELVQSKLDSLEFRFTELFVQLKEQSEGFMIHQQRMEAAQKGLNSVIERHEQKILQLVQGMEDSLGSNVSTISDQSRRILELQTICSNHDLIRNSLFELRPKNMTYTRLEVPDCSGTTAKTSGLCLMDIGGAERIQVSMERHRFGGDWLIILQRFDGSENFHRNWTDYRNGFGTIGQEFWLGLERLHLLTKAFAYELLVELEDFAGTYRYARYDRFAVGPESEHYPLDQLGTFSGTVANSFAIHKGANFTTLDEGPFKHCPRDLTGGWWYGVNGVCYTTHLTGTWRQANLWTSMVWNDFGTPANLGLKFARMMIRKI